MKLLLDSNVFITAHNTYYPVSVFPGVWKAILNAHDFDSTVFSIDWVRSEVLAGNSDELTDWIKTLPNSFFLDTSAPEVQARFAAIINDVQLDSVYSNTAKSDFAKGADGWLIAYAAEHAFTIVTQDILKPSNTVKHASVVNVAQKHGVSCIGTFELIRQLNVKFEIASTLHRPPDP